MSTIRRSYRPLVFPYALCCIRSIFISLEVLGSRRKIDEALRSNVNYLDQSLGADMRYLQHEGHPLWLL